LKCALNVVEEFDHFDLPVRIGVHTGELQVRDGSLSGLALDIASRVADLGDRNGVIASRTVMDLVAGSGIGFEDLGEYTLPEFSEPWRMFRVIGSPA
jgi:class 3 adenylate cyclase